MKLIPLAMIFASAIFCNTIRDKIDPPPPPPPPPTLTPSTERSVELTPPPAGLDPSGRPANSNVAVSVSGGVLNEKAISLPQPVYPSAARAVRATGKVMVQVTVNTSGTVDSAVAVSGHPLLQAAAEKPAREAKFKPLILSGGQAVKVMGVINYDFVPE